jgi:hypothetical protein
MGSPCGQSSVPVVLLEDELHADVLNGKRPVAGDRSVLGVERGNGERRDEYEYQSVHMGSFDPHRTLTSMNAA